MLYDSIYMKCPEQNVDYWLPGAGGWKGATTSGYRASFGQDEKCSKSRLL